MEPIPEETTTNTRVTASVPATKPATEKNPGRVAAGKRLVEFNRKAREAKKADSASADITTAQTVSAAPSANQNSEESSNTTGIYILAIGGFIISLMGLYYKRKEVLTLIKGEEKKEIESPPAIPLPPTKIPRPQKSNIIPMA